MPTVNLETSSLLQRVRYRAVHSDSVRALVGAIKMARRELNKDGLPLADELFWEQELARLESKLNLLNVAKEAFESGRQSITAPGEATIKKAESLAQQIDKLIVSDAEASQAIDIATETFRLFNKIQET